MSDVPRDDAPPAPPDPSAPAPPDDPAPSAFSRSVTFLTSPAPYTASRHLYLALLGLSFLAAFVSLAVQVRGLIGSNGLTPAAAYLDRVHGAMGSDAYTALPTLFWLSSSDTTLVGAAWLGALLSLLLILHIAPRLILILLWILYGSYLATGGVFLGYQWDILLAECGLLAVLLAPGGLWPRPGRAAPPARWTIYVHHLLLFRLMFCSGVVKLGSGDETWWGLTAMHYHYWTQPLPTPVAWYLHQLPDMFHRIEVVLTFAIELGLPLLIFAPRWPRRIAGLGMAGLMAMIALTGNYCFFNLLTAALALLLLDDDLWPRRFVPAVVPPRPPSILRNSPGLVTFVTLTLLNTTLVLNTLLVRNRVIEEGTLAGSIRAVWLPLSSALDRVVHFLHRHHVMGSYGLFATMTTQRDEIAIEASDDGQVWYEIQFRYKPGDVARAPRFNAPHQPRLDWQLWFASLDLQGHRGLLESLAAHILKGTPEVLDLIGDERLVRRTPKYLRLFLDSYEFTNVQESKTTGHWWKRTRRGTLSGPMSLKNP